MSINSEIARITGNVAAAYVAAAEKGAEMPQQPNSENLAGTILSIRAYSEPVTEELDVTANGEYTPGEGVDGYSRVTVDVKPKLEKRTVTPTTSAQTVTPNTGYDGMSEVTVEAVKAASPADLMLTFDANTGVVRATTAQMEGYVGESNQHEILEIPTYAGATVVPGTNDVVVPAKRYLLGPVYVKGDQNLAPENIKKGKSIFGVEGTASGGSTDGASIGYETDADGKFTTLRFVNAQIVPQYIGVAGMSGLTTLTTVDFSGSPDLRVIGAYAFQRCTNLTQVNLPDSVETIGMYAFQNCPVVSGGLPAAIKSIGNYALNGWTFPAWLEISAESVGNYAFQNAKGVKTAYIRKSCTTLGSNVFYGSPVTRIYVEADAAPSGWNAEFAKTGSNTYATVTYGYKEPDAN